MAYVTCIKINDRHNYSHMFYEQGWRTGGGVHVLPGGGGGSRQEFFKGGGGNRVGAKSARSFIY